MRFCVNSTAALGRLAPWPSGNQKRPPHSQWPRSSCPNYGRDLLLPSYLKIIKTLVGGDGLLKRKKQKRNHCRLCPRVQQKRRKEDCPRQSGVATSGQSRWRPPRAQSCTASLSLGSVVGKVDDERPGRQGLSGQSIHPGATPGSLPDLIYSLSSPIRAQIIQPGSRESEFKPRSV